MSLCTRLASPLERKRISEEKEVIHDKGKGNWLPCLNFHSVHHFFNNHGLSSPGDEGYSMLTSQRMSCSNWTDE